MIRKCWKCKARLLKRADSLCKECRNKYTLSWYYKNKELARYQNRERNRRLREQVLLEYGRSCRCCGERTYEFLAIDHIFDDGAAHRKIVGKGGSNFYYWLRKHKYPKDRFQILCHNCNFAKSHYGKCPHNTMRSLVVATPP